MSELRTEQAATHRWLVDTERSLVEFRVRNFWGLITVTGRFDRFDGSDNGTTIRLLVDAGSLNTGNEKRDKHLRSADFFDVEHHPKLSFDSTSIIEETENTIRVVGDLTVAGQTAQIEFDALVSADGDELEIEAEATVDQRVFGMTWSPLGMVHSLAKLHVRARLVSEHRKRSEAGG